MSVAPVANADGLDDKKHDTQTQIDSNNAQTSQDQTTLDQAAAALQTAQEDLVDAQADLVAKQDAVQEAKAEASRLAGVAAQAQQTLANRLADLKVAEQAVADGEAKIQSQRDTIGLVAQTAVQQNTTLLSFSVMFSNFDTSQLNNRIQWISLEFDASQNALDQLLQAQAQLQQAQQLAEQAEQAASDAQAASQQASQDASAGLVDAQQAEAIAKRAQQTVATKVAASQKAQSVAQAAIDADQAKQSQLQQQLALIEQQIADAAAAVKHVTTTQAPAISGSAVSSSSAQAIAKSLMPDYGFGADQFGCLVNLWNYESGWRVNARNPSSGAYGIPQSLPPTKMASAGSDWMTNPTTQIKWGLTYIKARYGTPCGAWAHERSYNWY
ncbi:MAG: hypothetical protein FWD80_01285 [Propionibacteriaceae bacterium]|nr:hypothetical protein [Propionibacteriaceae bacterium]